MFKKNVFNTSFIFHPPQKRLHWQEQFFMCVYYIIQPSVVCPIVFSLLLLLLLFPSSRNLIACWPLSPPTPQPHEPQLSTLCVQFLAAMAQALPPDHIDQSCISQTERKTSTDEHFDPQPVDTSK